MLFPTANLWQVLAHGGHPDAIDRLLRLCPPSGQNRPELIYPDIDALRRSCPRIDPVIDTLLFYHLRPLTVRVAAGPKVPHYLIDERGFVHARVATDSACYRLCEDLSQPLVACLAAGPGSSQLPTRFGKIGSDVLRGVNHVESRRWHEEYHDGLAIVVSIDRDGQLQFE